MTQVQELARDVIKEYNVKMGDNRITRTLVSVSSAAKDKVNKTNASVKRSASDIDDSVGTLGKKPKFMNFVASTSNDEEPKKSTDGFILPPINPRSCENEEMSSLPPSVQRIVDKSKNHTYPRGRKILLPFNVRFPACYFILVTLEYVPDDPAYGILQRSASFCKIPMQIKYNNGTKNYQIWIADCFICEETGNKESEAKLRACDMALDILSEYCYKISLKNRFTSDGAHVDIIDVQDNTTVGKNQGKLGDSNVGHKLLSMMGWSGGGLGREGAGIADPITAVSIFGKQGLGYTDSQLGAGKVFKQKIEKIIKEYMGTSGSNDLVFTTGFDNEQRAEMHKLARRYGLKSKSFGKGDDRHLTISKKFDPKTLLEELIYNGGETEKYILKPPNNLKEEFYKIIQ